MCIVRSNDQKRFGTTRARKSCRKSYTGEILTRWLPWYAGYYGRNEMRGFSITQQISGSVVSGVQRGVVPEIFRSSVTWPVAPLEFAMELVYLCRLNHNV
uniref:Uncharacterized protein n=1 Tax=Oryza brachyantha TaxID=4533 RepID=J3KWC1_ORYBR